jgi:hypothetical protein
MNDLCNIKSSRGKQFISCAIWENINELESNQHQLASGFWQQHQDCANVCKHTQQNKKKKLVRVTTKPQGSRQN